MSARSISRRTVLRGMGTAISLPLLEAMMPGTARSAMSQPESPLRLAFVYVPNGMHMPAWRPADEARLTRMPPILQSLEPHRQSITMLSGLTLNGARALGDGGGDHARSVASFLTGAHPKKTDGADIRNGISVDQLLADKIGDQTRFASLELGLEQSAQAGRCDSGYSCVYTSNMCWRSDTSPVAKEVNPAAVFDRLFGSSLNQSAQDNPTRGKYRSSILDFALEDARALRGKVGRSDQRKLDEYLNAIRDIEARIQRGDKLPHSEPVAPEYARPHGVPAEFGEHVKVMYDLMVLAMQTDSTRVLTMMIANAGSNRNYPMIDVNEGHHTLSHHGKDAAKQAKIQRINTYHAELFAYLITKLSQTSEAEGSLLDHCIVVYGSGISDGDRHNHDDLPVLLAGKGKGTLQTGRHRTFAKETPLTNLYLSLMDRMGVREKSFSDSTGRLDLG